MKKLICILAASLFFAGCASTQEQPAKETVITFTDDLGNSYTADEKPQSVAALIGSFADVWVTAGGKDTLKAAAHDTFTSFDLDLPDDVEDLGAIKSPDTEKILALHPDLVLASTKTQADVDMQPILEEAGIPVLYFDVSGIDDYLDMLEICTQLTGDEKAYEEYGVKVKEQADQAIAKADGSKPSVLYLRSTGKSVKAKGSKGTVLGEMLADLDTVNVADGSGLLENLSMEAIAEADPEYIFIVYQGSDDADARENLEKSLLSNPAWSELSAVKNGKVYVLDQSLYNLKPNARWGEAYENLADILYG